MVSMFQLFFDILYVRRVCIKWKKFVQAEESDKQDDNITGLNMICSDVREFDTVSLITFLTPTGMISLVNS